MALGYIAMYLLAQAAPQAFKFVNNSGLVRSGATSTFDFGALIGSAIVGWVVGYVWAWLYNRWA